MRYCPGYLEVIHLVIYHYEYFKSNPTAYFSDTGNFTLFAQVIHKQDITNKFKTCAR